MNKKRVYEGPIADFLESLEEAKKSADFLYDAAVSAGVEFTGCGYTGAAFNAQTANKQLRLEVGVQSGCTQFRLHDEGAFLLSIREHAEIVIARNNTWSSWVLKRNFTMTKDSDKTSLRAAAQSVGLGHAARRELRTDKRIKEIIASLSGFFLEV
jgi:hypothetical protein